MVEKSELALDLARPILEERRADGLARGVCRLLDEMGYATLLEMPLGTGRRPDVIGIDGRGRTIIVEIKSGLQDCRTDQKWPDYLPWCDEFFFVVGRDFPRTEIPEGVGLAIADRYGAEIIRSAPMQTITAHRRRKLTLRFARISAGRLKFIFAEERSPR